jgi:hypothetical protein
MQCQRPKQHICCNRQEFLSERERTSNLFNLQRLNLNQTADLAGGGPLRLIGGAINEWQISLGAAPHATHYTRCWLLVAEMLLLESADLAGGGLLRLIGGVINEWQISASSSRGVQRPM